MVNLFLKPYHSKSQHLLKIIFLIFPFFTMDVHALDEYKPDSTLDSASSNIFHSQTNPSNSIPVSSESDSTLTDQPENQPSQKNLKADSNVLELPQLEAVGRNLHLQQSVEPGRIRIDQKQLRLMPASQNDPMRVALSLPGVSLQNDLSVRLFVRGGKAEETRVFLDGTPLIHPFHFAGAYSVFNPEMISHFDFHRTGWPLDGKDALSGAMNVTTRTSSLDSIHAISEISFLRGNFVLGTPLWKGKMGLTVGWHAYWYDDVARGGLETLSFLSQSKSLKKINRDFNTYLDLPDFRDFQTNLTIKPYSKLTWNINLLLPRDRMSYYKPKGFYYEGENRVSPLRYETAFVVGSDQELSYSNGRDSTISIYVPGKVLLSVLDWKPNSWFSLKLESGWQEVDWDVKFLEEEKWTDDYTPDGRYIGIAKRPPSNLSFDWKRQYYNGAIKTEFDLNQFGKIKFGIDVLAQEEKYNTALPYAIQNTLVNGDIHPIEGVSSLYPNFTVFTLNKVPELNKSIDKIIETLRFDYLGVRRESSAGGYLGWMGDLTPNWSVEVGARSEWENRTHEFESLPRLRSSYRINADHLLLLSAGRHTQNDLPFQAIHSNHNLLPERSWEGSVGYTWGLSKNLRLHLEGWAKKYDRLLTSKWINASSFSAENSPYSEAELKEMSLENQKKIQSLYTPKKLFYDNSGEGGANGLEISVYYDAVANWSGWMSFEKSDSWRKDAPGESKYPFASHRPYTFSWINSWDLPSQRKLSLGIKYASGKPYTTLLFDGSSKYFPYTDETVRGDTIFVIGEKLSERTASYLRVDLKISKTSKLFGHPLESYFEIWNLTNSPNFFIRDVKSKKIITVDANWPIPVIFAGVRWTY